MPTREALEPGRVGLRTKIKLRRAAPHAGAAGPATGISLLRSSARARLGLVAVALFVLWLAVYWALA